MKKLFWNLSSATIALLLIVTVWGHFVSPDRQAAFDTLAVIAAVFALAVHSIVYTYFIAAGKFAQSAIEEHGFTRVEAVDEAKSNKRQAFRYAFLAILACMAAVFLYFASSPLRGDAAIWRGWAAIAAYLMIPINLYAMKKEWKYLLDNLVISDEILAAVTADREQRGLGTPHADAPPTSAPPAVPHQD